MRKRELKKKKFLLSLRPNLDLESGNCSLHVYIIKLDKFNNSIVRQDRVFLKNLFTFTPPMDSHIIFCDCQKKT